MTNKELDNFKEIFTDLMASGGLGKPVKFDKSKKKGYSNPFPIVGTVFTV